MIGPAASVMQDFLDTIYQQAQHSGADFALKALAAVALALIGWRLCKWLVNWERRLLLRAEVDEILAQFIRNLTYAAILVTVVVSGLELAGVPVTSLMTLMGAAALAIGLALKDSLSHIAAGLMLIILRPFHVGDRVTIAGQDGLIDGVYIFQTRLRTTDHRSVVLMNGAVIASPITNHSRNGMERISVTLRMNTGTDLALAVKTAQDLLAEDARIVKDPAPEVLVTDISNSGVGLSVRAWSTDAPAGLIRSDLLRNLHAAFTQHGFEFSQAPGT